MTKPATPAPAKHTPAAVVARTDPKWVDPGPPPRMPPEPQGVWPFGLSVMTAAGISRNRASLNAIDTLRMPPEIGVYRAELLEWIDKIEAYEAANGAR